MIGLGERLKKAREAINLGQKQVAALTGINYKTISNYENDRSEPDVEKLAMLCRLYSVSADEMINEKKQALDSDNSESRAQQVKMLSDVLVSLGFIKPGEDISDADFAFSNAIIAAMRAHFKK